MDSIAWLMFLAVQWISAHPAQAVAVLVPRVGHPAVMAVLQDQRQPTDHPWEVRLRKVELALAVGTARGELLVKDIDKITLNRDKRLKELEDWKREFEREIAEGEDPKETARAAKAKADAVETQVQSVTRSLWEDLIIQLGGPTAIAIVLGGLVKLAFGKIRKELIEHGSLPGNTTTTPEPVATRPDDRVRLNLRDA